ncbi:DUF924 family protein [Neptunicella sp. SCSIO 80796]|uniref:DUF924 family protein n=1 Tax=Neptunicella plasticusilytica TaxID=3117012 RepID=UPI003A4D3BEF
MYRQIIDFWFKEIEPSQWWKKDDEFDQYIRARFIGVYNQAIQGELFTWRRHSQGRLAEIIILDQFSRNMFRDKPQAFSQDNMALVLAQEAVAAGVDNELTPIQNSFLYMPFMHSESKLLHNIAEKLYRQNGIENNLDFELRHKAIIERFGRYPHRNDILGRESTEEEIDFLKQAGSSF